MQWLGQLLGLDDPAQGVEALARGQRYRRRLFRAGVCRAGRSALERDARGLFTGLTRGTTPAHLARATLEAIAYQVRDVFDVMAARSGRAARALMADGGASRNDLLDAISGRHHRAAGRPQSVFGRVCAGRGLPGRVGGWPVVFGVGIEQLPRPSDRFEPRLAAAERAKLYAGWKSAIPRTLFDAEAQIAMTV